MAAGRGVTSLYARRRAVNLVVLSLASVAAMIGVAALALILGHLLWNGVTSLSLAVFTETTPPPGVEGGGLFNAIYGSLVMVLVATLVGTPIGILAGTFLAEYASGTRLANIIRFVNDILLSAPSIVIGLFVYEMLVRGTGFSGWAGAAALGILVIPVVVRTTEDMLNLVPNVLREAAIALGAPKWKVIMTVSYRAAMQGLLTGVILAVARVSGETAPLLFTAFGNQFMAWDLSEKMPSLPVVIYQFALSPYEHWQSLAWAGAVIITFAILALNIGARVLSSGWSNPR